LSCRGLLIPLVAACLLLCDTGFAADELSDREAQGRTLFLTGRGSGPVPTASVGAGNVQVPAMVVPCASCHGRDGGGRPEGGIIPPNISWPALSAPFAASGRQRPAYTDSLVVRAITMGIDSGGRPLDPTMPRFHLSMNDVTSLLAYLRRLGTLPEPGLGDSALVLGTVVDASDAPVGVALSAYLSKINQNGGLLGRQIELHIEASDHGIARVMGTKAIFAVLAPTFDDDEQEAVAAADAQGVPVVGPLTQTPQATARSRYVFYLNGGTQSEARALAGFAATLPGPLVVVDDGTLRWHALTVAAMALLSSAGDAPTLMRPDDTRLLTHDGPILWLTDDPPGRSDRTDHVVLLPRELADHALAAGTVVRAWVAFTNGQPDVTEAAAAEYRALVAEYNLPRDNQSAQLHALAAAKIMVEALRRAGRDVTRERLVDALQNLQDFHTGLMPPVSYSATRRIGTDGVWIVPLGGGKPIWWNR
jgi:mono/diheme cytochrome c family protein